MGPRGRPEAVPGKHEQRARVKAGKSCLQGWGAALNIVHAFRDLHGKGMSYQDLNDGNFFIDPDAPGNEPVPGVHPNPIKLWPLYPTFIRNLFIRAFSRGMKDPNSRPSDNEWQQALIGLRDEILTCGACGYEPFASSLDVRDGRFRCPNAKCGIESSFPLILDTGKHQVRLFPGSRLYRCPAGENKDAKKLGLCRPYGMFMLVLRPRPRQSAMSQTSTTKRQTFSSTTWSQGRS